MQMKPDSWCFPRGEEWWRGPRPTSSEALTPVCSDRPWREESGEAAGAAGTDGGEGRKMEKQEGPEQFGGRGSVSYLWADAALQDSSASFSIPCFAGFFSSPGCERQWLVRCCTAPSNSGCFIRANTPLNQRGPPFAVNTGHLTANSF